jgi:hypothetical protein
MYAKITSSGGRRYLQLVEGYRTENGIPIFIQIRRSEILDQTSGKTFFTKG